MEFSGRGLQRFPHVVPTQEPSRSSIDTVSKFDCNVCMGRVFHFHTHQTCTTSPTQQIPAENKHYSSSSARQTTEFTEAKQHCEGQNIIIQQCADGGGCNNVLIALYHHSGERAP